jgi:aminopeptidase S
VLRDAGFDVSTPTFVLELDDRRAEYRNVIAQTRTGDHRGVVMVGAHLDSVRRGPGIDDNGTGVASLLEIATQMGGSPPVARAVRFGFWGAEEIDFEGSRGYVDSLSGDERPAFYLNLDMTGAPNAGYFVQGASGGPDGSATIAADLTRRFTALGVTPDPMELDGGSDFAPFVDAGIPSAGLLAGDSGRKSEDQARRWGGVPGEAFDRCYHSACDDLTNVDTTALDRFTDVAAGTVAYFASTGAGP